MLTGKKRKEADRIGGIELMLPWPSDLPTPDLGEDEEMDATAVQRRAAEAALGDLQHLDLVLVRVQAVCTRERNRHDLRFFLGCIIIGRRWVHASTQRKPKTMWVD